MSRKNDSLASRYRQVRADSLSWLEHVSAEDCGAQAMPDASPLKWHLAHTTWFFETFVLSQPALRERHNERQNERQNERHNFRPWDARFRELFNSYYQQVSSPYPRARRGLLTRPSLDEVRSWRAQVDEQVLACLVDLEYTTAEKPCEIAALIELGLQHEQQHQELMATDLLYLFSCNPLRPAVLDSVVLAPDDSCASISPRRQGWVEFGEGLVRIGHEGDGFCFDNETPAHAQLAGNFALSSSLVTNDDYLGFVNAGGYAQPRWWMAEGWEWVNAQQHRHPLYWRQDQAGQWHEFTLHGEQPLQRHQAVAHLSLFEADAYARWSGHRLPTETEWEHAARSAPQAFDELFGDCWQWTQSSYAPYPGFRPGDGAVGEYNGKFMLNQYVLRGSSSFTPAGHARPTYRNFFPAQACWQRTGIRLARDLV